MPLTVIVVLGAAAAGSAPTPTAVPASRSVAVSAAQKRPSMVASFDGAVKSSQAHPMVLCAACGTFD